MAKALCPKCKTVLERPVPQCPTCGVRFKVKAPAAPAPPSAPVQTAPKPPKDEVFESIFGHDDLPGEPEPVPPPVRKPAPVAAARPVAAAKPAVQPPKTPAEPSEAFDPDAARVFAEAFTARRASAPAEPEPPKPAAPVYEEPVYVPKAPELLTPFGTLKTESLHPKNLIPGFLFFLAAAHIFVFYQEGPVTQGLASAAGAATGLTVLTLAFDYWRFSR